MKYVEWWELTGFSLQKGRVFLYWKKKIYTNESKRLSPGYIVSLYVLMSAIWFFISQPLIDDASKLLTVLRLAYYLVSSIVLFALMKRQSALREGRDELHLVVDRLRETVLIHRDEVIIYANPYALEFFGAEGKDDLVGKRIIDVVCPEYREIAQRRINLLAQGVPSDVMEQKFTTLTGDIRDVEVVGVPIVFQGKSSTQVIIRDITERKLTEEALRRSDKLAAVGELAAGIAHEIRNPLTSLKGFLQLMLPQATEIQKRYFDVMHSEITRMESITNELLVLAKPQIHSRVIVSVTTIIDDVITLLNPRAILDNVVIERTQELENTFVECNPNQIKQVFVNITKNAIEAMPSGGTLHIQLKNVEERLYLMFRDEGMGISPDRISHIGMPFFTTKENGTGLGLLVSSRIIDNHSGKLEMSSEVGKGTTVTIVLPFASP